MKTKDQTGFLIGTGSRSRANLEEWLGISISITKKIKTIKNLWFRAPPMFYQIASLHGAQGACSIWVLLETGKLYLCNPPITRKQGDFSLL
jgi:hypothetical protein